MTVSIAITGKSGSGKTTFVKSILSCLDEVYPDKSVLLVDNDLSCELGYSFGIDVKSTIYDIKSGNYKYTSKLPEGMTKQEFIEWAIEDILINLYEDVDLLVTGHVSADECRCFAATQVKEALVRLFKNYDFVIFDCEYDLEYLSHLVNYPIDVTIIVSNPTIASAFYSSKIKDSSLKLATGGQVGAVINKVKGTIIPEEVYQILKEYDVTILGKLYYDESLVLDTMSKSSKLMVESAKEILYRLNLPQ